MIGEICVSVILLVMIIIGLSDRIKWKLEVRYYQKHTTENQLKQCLSKEDYAMFVKKI